jgi:diguanylate cyclase (GGDEF)-like protein
LNIEGIRSDFVIYVVDDEESIRSVVMDALKGVQYQVETFSDGETALARVKEAPPHVIISDIRMPGMSGIDLLRNVKELSSDIQFVIMTSHASLETALEAIKLGAYDYIHKPFEDIQDVIKCIDRTVERIYLQYQNEQLLEELARKNSILTKMNAQVTQEKEEVVKINSLMSQLALCKDLDSVIQTFLNQTYSLLNKPLLLLTHVPSHLAFVATHVVDLEKDKIKNLGLNLKHVDPKDYLQKIADPQAMVELQKLMLDVFKVPQYLAFPIEDEQGISAYLIIMDAIDDISVRRLLDSFVSIFKVSFMNARMQKRIHDMAIKDPLTGLFNRRFFNEKLEEEISRSRRTRLPVSLIYMDIDHFKKYNDQNGHPMGDILLKMFAQVLKKTSRKNDVIARIGGEEFVIILPHTDKMGAAIKAEKLRRVIEATSFPHGEKQPLGKVSASMGVAEYPSHCHDPEGLVKAADEALYQVKSTTRNRVCIATVPEDFQIDFEPMKVQPYEEKKK